MQFELSVKSKETGADTGRKVLLPADVFSITPVDQAIYMDVKRHLAACRQGTHKSKERSEMSGSTRKLIRQKGTGGARKGDINSPVLRGGARVFGPRPRDYSFKLNKQEMRLARHSAFAYKAQADRVVVVEDFSFEKPSTRQFVQLCDHLGVKDRKVLFLLGNDDATIYLSGRNLPKVEVLPVWQAYTYAILNSDYVVLTEGSLSYFEDEDACAGEQE